MPCWQQRVEGPQWVQERYGPSIRALRRRRPDLLWPARCQRWGDGAPPTRRSSATGRLRRWSPCSQARGRSPARGRHPRPPSSAVVSRCPVRPRGWERSRGQARGPHGRPPRLGGRRHPGGAPPPCPRPGAGGGPHGVAVGGPGRAGAQRQGGRRHLSAPRPQARPPRQPGAHASLPQASPAGAPERWAPGRGAALVGPPRHHAARGPARPCRSCPQDRRTVRRGPPPEAARDRPSPWPRGRGARAHTPPERPPARQPRCRHARPPALRPRSPPPAAGHGWERASPKTRAPKAARHRARGGEDSPGLPHPGLSARGQQRVCTRRHSKLQMSLRQHSR